MIFINEEIESKEVYKGLSRKILSYGGNLMVVECHAEKGVKVPIHSHIHEQCGYIISGKFQGIIDNEKTTLTSGDSYYVKPNQEHGLVCLEEGSFLDIFTPQREDFK
ncbi:cupin domain-containing protein [Abyssisolibacter fermentans]|uniref:cupin domain-containing protein n=1 Tax=Abyssisolibacter fermentans TaxID=1766203 RepID=UPI0008327DCA|nr:cupin domain-containing protein [Abyssisolibacter fermentans]